MPENPFSDCTVIVDEPSDNPPPGCGIVIPGAAPGEALILKMLHPLRKRRSSGK